MNTTPHNLNLGIDNGSGNRINVGFRFIPTLANTIRVTGSNGAINAQIDATTGAVTATDAALTYVTGDANFGATVNLTSIGYTGFNGDATTQMFGFDANTGSMVMFDQANGTAGLGIGTSGYINTGVSLNTVLNLLSHSNVYDNTYISIMYSPTAAANLGFITSNYFGDSMLHAQLKYSILYNIIMISTSQFITAEAPQALLRLW